MLNERSEILFVYQVKDANPNGDPLEDNKPRTDPETGVATVTDVRIKRWIRDYWRDRLNKPIWIIEDWKEDGTLKEAFERLDELMKKAKKETKEIDSSNPKFKEALALVSNTWIDVRTFGCVMPTGGKRTVTLTGPVQFSGFNRSFHKVEPMTIQGTAAFPSKAKQHQRSFREDQILPYACIGVYGVVNEIASRETGMTEEDRHLLLEGLWKGCLDLISRSKFGHQPLMLIHIKYNDGYRIGDLTQRIKFIGNVEDDKLRDVTDFKLDLRKLKEDIKKVDDKISAVEYIYDDRLRFEGNLSPADLPKAKPLSL